VFAYHTCQKPDQYDPLRVEDWRFRVMAKSELGANKARSITLAFLDRHGCRPYKLDELKDAIERTHASSADRGTVL